MKRDQVAGLQYDPACSGCTSRQPLRRDRLTLGLVDHEVDKCYAYETERAPDKEHLGLQIRMIRIHEVWCRVCNRPVEEPIAGCRHAQAFRANLQWEKFASDHPSNRAPGGRKEEDVNADKSNGSALSREILERCCRSSDRDDELANAHSEKLCQSSRHCEHGVRRQR